MGGMPEDVLEWGSGEAIEGRPRSPVGLKVPPLMPQVLAGVGAVAYFVSLSQPWRLYTLSTEGAAAATDASFSDRREFALSFGLGMAYTVALLVLAAVFPIVLMGSRRMRRVATGVAIAVGVMSLAQLFSVVMLGGKESVYFNDTPGLKTVVITEVGLYAAFAAVVALVAATIAIHYVGTRPQRPVADEPEYATDTPRDLTVSAS